MCGLEIHVDGGRVTGIRGNRDDVWSRGHICPKGVSLAALHDDPDRIRRPMIKVDGQWREVSWDAAFRRCTELLTPVIEKYGIGAVTAYTGNPLAHSFSLARYAGVLMGMSGMPVTYSPGTVDQWPKNLSSHLMYGLWWNFPVPDIERTDLMVIMGASPAASQGSLLAAPDVMGLIDGIRKRGTVIVIDPVRTPTAARADEWLPIVPGTDAALLLAVAHTLFDEDLVAPGPHVDGVETMRRVAADWPPERVGAVTGIPEARIRLLARELAGTERSVVYGRIGLCNQEFGSLASWLVDVVNILTGHFDVPGGAMFPRPAAWSITTQPLPGLEGGLPEFGRWHTRVRGAKEVLGQAPVSCMAEEIATPGEGQLKALITVAGNPVLSTPGGDKLDEVLPMLEAMISVDLWINETTRHADVILPGLSPLEQPHHDDLILLFAIRSIANYSAPVFDPGGRPHEWEILIRLTGLCTGTPAEDVDVAAIDDGFFDYLSFTRGLDGAEIRKLYTQGGPERMLDLTLRTRSLRGPVRQEPRRADAGPAQGQPERHRLRADGAAAARHLGHARQEDPARAAIPARRSAPAGRAAGAPGRAAGAGEPPAPAIEQHLVAQRAGADEGKRPLHVADSPRRRRALRSRRRRRRHREIGRGRDQGAGRDHGRDQAGRGVDAARLGPRQAGHPHGGRQRLAGGQHECPFPADVYRRTVGQRRAQRHTGHHHRRPSAVPARTETLKPPDPFPALFLAPLPNVNGTCRPVVHLTRAPSR
jgi:anaerobic selenocysteine-containing dehydrogenase